MLTSRYRLPSAVEAIALDPRSGEGGAHEVWTRQLGFAEGPISQERYSLSPDLAVSRYTFVTPDFVMGASIVPRLPAARWTAISSQNRWNGVVMADGPDARVYATPEPQGGRSTYNAVLAAQSRGTQIVQRLPPPFSRGAGDMAIWIGPRLPRVEREGWIFVEGSAFVAVRPAFGGYAADPSNPSYRLLDQRSPVIIQAATRADHASFDAFQGAVLAAPLSRRRAGGEVRRSGRCRPPPLFPGQRPAAGGRWQAHRAARRLGVAQPLRAASARQPHGGDHRRRAETGAPLRLTSHSRVAARRLTLARQEFFAWCWSRKAGSARVRRSRDAEA